MEKKSKKKQLNKYLQLTSVVFQMGITIYLGAYFGKWLDGYFKTGNKTFLIITILFALIISLYNVIRQLKNINDKYD
ncbi:AtpZ/AtpI family protein [Lutibacter citreus]|uniref:AtpZ/AtpI family protein n=1 Tax=Lutibacter citreus TaxID=2138210 RepID=UPI000DBE50E4|nr:AtpZ/AtpI family protein [Lutibacter citreus]